MRGGMRGEMRGEMRHDEMRIDFLVAYFMTGTNYQQLELRQSKH